MYVKVTFEPAFLTFIPTTENNKQRQKVCKFEKVSCIDY